MAKHMILVTSSQGDIWCDENGNVNECTNSVINN